MTKLLDGGANIGQHVANAIENRPVDQLDKVYSKLMLGSKHQKKLGAGERRARQRAQRAQQPSAETTPTRQQIRRSTKLRERQAITKAKAVAAAHGIDPRRIRRIEDIERVLGS